MSVAFITLTTGENALSLAMANELVLAYSERRQAIEQSSVSALVAGDNTRDKTLWLAMQVWMEANCTSFIDHVSGPLNPAGDGFLYFTLATWRSAAGLNANGFRRSLDNGISFSYGNITAGDDWGKWNFEDFQKGFGALQMTVKVASPYEGHKKYGGDWYPEHTYAEAAAEYNAADWVLGGGPGGPGVPSVERAITRLYRFAVPYDNDFTCYVERTQHKYSIVVPTFRPRVVELWRHGKTSDILLPVMGFAGTTRTWTFFEHGDLTGESLQKVDEVAEGSDSPVLFNYLNVGVVPSEAPSPVPDGCVTYGYDSDYNGGLIKWNFTNA